MIYVRSGSGRGVLHACNTMHKQLIYIIFLSFFCAFSTAQAAPDTFSEAKTALRQHIYFDQALKGELYCGCPWRWTGKTGGRFDLEACGYTPRKNRARAERLEWEHVVPAWVIGHQRQCWQNGGRANCARTDPVFRKAEADLHNLAPSIGEVNGDRSNYRYAMLPSAPKQYGTCTTRTDFKQRATEPRDAVKGQVARISLYMSERYNLRLSSQQRKLFEAWHKQYPVSDWEKLRDKRIEAIQGNSNPWVAD